MPLTNDWGIINIYIHLFQESEMAYIFVWILEFTEIELSPELNIILQLMSLFPRVSEEN